MNIPYYIEQYNNDIYELHLLYETFNIDRSNIKELNLLIKTIIHHKQNLYNIILYYRHNK